MPRRLSLIVLLALGAALAVPGAALADRAFSVRYELNAPGSIQATGNTLLSCATGAPRCADVRAGIGSGAILNNNENAMVYVDTDGSSATYASSRATLSIPAGARVAWAGLYWSGVDQDNSKDCRGTLPPTAPSRDQAKLRFGTGPYQNVVASQVDVANSPFRGIYGAFAEVTNFVRASGAGTYTVADVRALEGKYCHSGWSLIVVLADATQPLRNLTVIDGLGTVLATDANEIPFTLSGFRTPPTGPVRTELGFVGYEGDLGTTGDYAELDGTKLANAAAPANNFFNSTLTNATGAPLGTPRSPTFQNQLGFDLNTYDASPLLGNDQRSATLTFATRGDGYHPALFTLATDIYEPDLKLEKSVTIVKQSPTPPGYDTVAEHGDTLRYAVRATNSGIDAADDVALSDAIPPGTTYVPGSLRIDGVAQTDAENDDRAEIVPTAGEARFRIGAGADQDVGGRLATGASSTVGFEVRVDDDLPDGTTVANQAVARFTEATLGTTEAAFSNFVQTPVVVPDLTIEKTLTTPLIPGVPAAYDVVVSNVGTAPTQGLVTVTDTLPDDYDLAPPVTAAGTGWTCAVVVRSVTCTRADRLDKAAAYPPIVLTATLNAGFDGVLSNTAVVAGGGETNVTNNSDTEATGAGPQADVAVVKTAEPDRVNVGEELTFAFLVGNSGPSVASNVRLADTVPAGFTVVGVTTGADAACTVDGRALACQVGTLNGAARDLAPDQTVRIALRVRAEAVLGGQSVRNTAQVVSDTPDTDPSNNADDTGVTVDAVSNLLTSKTVRPAAPRAGGPITYTISVRNRGPNVATGVAVVDTDVPAAVTLSSYRVTAGAATCRLEGRRAICQSPSIAVGETVVIEATGTVARGAGGADLANGAIAQPDAVTTEPTGEGAAVAVDATASADVSVVKTMAAVVRVGAETRVSLRVRNAGPSAAENVVVTDALPAGLTPVLIRRASDGVQAVKGSGGRCAGGERVACALGTLRAGESETLRFVVRVTRTGGYRNTAVVGAATFDPNLADNTSTATTTTITGRKTSDRRALRPGDTASFRLAVRNTGSRSARRVDVCDVLPRGLSVDGAPRARTRTARRACWRIALLPPRTTRRFTLTATASQVPRSTRVVNRLEVEGTTAAGRTVRLRPSVARVTG